MTENRQLRIAPAVLVAAFALSGCGAVTSEEHKVQAAVRHKGVAEAQYVVNSISKKVSAIKLHCHASPAHLQSVERNVAKRYGVHLPSAAAIERAICR